MFGGTVIMFLGGIHYWWPKIFGRMYSQAWAKAAAVIVFVGFNLTFFSQFVMGSKGMPRRYATYPPQFQVYHDISTIGSYVLSAGFVIMAVYLIQSLFNGRRAPANPWGGATLEWQCDSPPPHENFEETPEPQEPYDFSRIEYDAVTGAYVTVDRTMAR
jgi:cytochrome c oxidase subunit 1